MKTTPFAAALLCCLMLVSSAQAQTGYSLGTGLVSDFHFVANNAEADTEDVVTSPLHMPDLWASDGLLRKPAFYYTLLGAAALLGGSFALDQTVRARLRDMPDSGATALEDSADVATGVGGAMLYGYGLYEGDQRAREYALTAAEGAGVGTLVTLVLKYGFGRLRPYQDGHSHAKFSDGGQSFPSGEATPIFAMAAGVSQYFDNAWYAALPAYSVAMAMGFGRMGHDAHWLSDIAGAALVGVGTTELLLYLHQEHADNPGRLRVFPVAAPHQTGIGLSLAF